LYFFDVILALDY